MSDGFDGGGALASGSSGAAEAACLALLIEDDPLVSEAMRLALEALGCRVLTSSSGDAAVALVAAGRTIPDLVIADYRLSGSCDGIEAVAAIRAETGVQVPACVVTSELDNHVRDRARRIGARFLPKPVSTEDIAALLRGL